MSPSNQWSNHKSNLLKWYYIEMSKAFGIENYNPRVLYANDQYLIYDPDYDQRMKEEKPDYFHPLQDPVALVTNDYGELYSADEPNRDTFSALTVLFMAGVTEMDKLMEFYKNYNHCEIDPGYQEMDLARDVGHYVFASRLCFWDFHFYTLCCYDAELGYYYIHSDNGEFRASKDDRWGYCVDNVTSDGDHRVIPLTELKEKWNNG